MSTKKLQAYMKARVGLFSWLVRERREEGDREIMALEWTMGLSR